jgi:predicted GNAT family acetyltransferase
MIELVCTPETFRPAPHAEVRWLDQEADLDLYARAFYRDPGAEPPTREDWEAWQQEGYRFCGLVREDCILARAAVWTCSATAWELAAVKTQPEHRSRGCARAVCSFITTHILASGRTATCHTDATNTAMLRVAETLGYHRR